MKILNQIWFGFFLAFFMISSSYGVGSTMRPVQMSSTVTNNYTTTGIVSISFFKTDGTNVTDSTCPTSDSPKLQLQHTNPTTPTGTLNTTSVTGGGTYLDKNLVSQSVSVVTPAYFTCNYIMAYSTTTTAIKEVNKQFGIPIGNSTDGSTPPGNCANAFSDMAGYTCLVATNPVAAKYVNYYKTNTSGSDPSNTSICYDPSAVVLSTGSPTAKYRTYTSYGGINQAPSYTEKTVSLVVDSTSVTIKNSANGNARALPKCSDNNPLKIYVSAADSPATFYFSYVSSFKAVDASQNNLGASQQGLATPTTGNSLQVKSGQRNTWNVGKLSANGVNAFVGITSTPNGLPGRDSCCVGSFKSSPNTFCVNYNGPTFLWALYTHGCNNYGGTPASGGHYEGSGAWVPAVVLTDTLDLGFMEQSTYP